MPFAASSVHVPSQTARAREKAPSSVLCYNVSLISILLLVPNGFLLLVVWPGAPFVASLLRS